MHIRHMYISLSPLWTVKWGYNKDAHVARITINEVLYLSGKYVMDLRPFWRQGKIREGTIASSTPFFLNPGPIFDWKVRRRALQIRQYGKKSDVIVRLCRTPMASRKESSEVWRYSIGLLRTYDGLREIWVTCLSKKWTILRLKIFLLSAVSCKIIETSIIQASSILIYRSYISCFQMLICRIKKQWGHPWPYMEQLALIIATKV